MAIGPNWVFMENKNYKEISKEGITAVIISNGKILILKRIWLPFITHPGYWSFVTGARKQTEEYVATAYREIKEETGIDKSQLELLEKDIKIKIISHKKDVQWTNQFFIFRTDENKINLNIENRAYKWVSIEELESMDNTTLNYIQSKIEILKLIKSKL
jgi:8-oxo-dGTP pyrophosphatase MutT (NUDIX family)